MAENGGTVEQMLDKRQGLVRLKYFLQDLVPGRPGEERGFDRVVSRSNKRRLVLAIEFSGAYIQGLQLSDYLLLNFFQQIQGEKTPGDCVASLFKVCPGYRRTLKVGSGHG
ncbi:hypothetical protein ACFRJ8_19925 [Arthrobacter sp. NPDC056886]|uniref:hypothetical protein n=1 Tax=Arthrobacter sp. NPDC056886 TaxID=3345960 RepID=UPI00366F3B8F